MNYRVIVSVNGYRDARIVWAFSVPQAKDRAARLLERELPRPKFAVLYAYPEEKPARD